MTTIHQTPDGQLLVASKGAVEALAPSLRALAGPDGPQPLTPAEPASIHAQAEADAAQGYRVLALAGRPLPALPARVEDAEQELVLYGLVAMADPPAPRPPRRSPPPSRPGSTPIVVTGDHAATARAIAARLGILDGRQVLSGADLAGHGPTYLAEHVADVAVYARTTPEQKLDIVEAWKARGQVVAMTGDGVNDAPALRQADVGVAMGQAGTEVAKQAADMVLADDNFATIVKAVREGRRTYDNLRRFVRYGLTGGSAEVWVMLLAPLVGLPLALLPTQVLWINLVTHGLPGLALGVEQAEPGTMRQPPRRPGEGIFARGLWQHVLAMGLLTGTVSLGLGTWGQATGRPWQTMTFTSLALLQLGNALAVRSEHESVFRLGLGSNRSLGWTVPGTLLVQIGLLYWAPAQAGLDLEPLSLAELASVLLASTTTFWAIDAGKLTVRPRASGRTPPSAEVPAAHRLRQINARAR
jgi:Ca2+-transporting ATPase